MVKQVHVLLADRREARKRELGQQQVESGPGADQDARATSQPPHQQQIDPEAEPQRGTVARVHQDAREATEDPARDVPALRSRRRAAILEGHHPYPARKLAEEGPIATTTDADDLDLVEPRQIPREVQGCPDRPPHPPGGRQQEDQPALASGGIRRSRPCPRVARDSRANRPCRRALGPGRNSPHDRRMRPTPSSRIRVAISVRFSIHRP